MEETKTKKKRVILRPWDEACGSKQRQNLAIEKQHSLTAEGGSPPNKWVLPAEWMNRGHFLHPALYEGADTASQLTPSPGHQVTHCGNRLWQQQLVLFKECFPFLHPKSLKSPPWGIGKGKDKEKERQGEEGEEGGKGGGGGGGQRRERA